jgi:hypothetical protein
VTNYAEAKRKAMADNFNPTEQITIKEAQSVFPPTGDFASTQSKPPTGRLTDWCMNYIG